MGDGYCPHGWPDAAACGDCWQQRSEGANGNRRLLYLCGNCHTYQDSPGHLCVRYWHNGRWAGKVVVGPVVGRGPMIGPRLILSPGEARALHEALSPHCETCNCYVAGFEEGYARGKQVRAPQEEGASC